MSNSYMTYESHFYQGSNVQHFTDATMFLQVHMPLFLSHLYNFAPAVHTAPAASTKSLILSQILKSYNTDI